MLAGENDNRVIDLVINLISFLNPDQRSTLLTSQDQNGQTIIDLELSLNRENKTEILQTLFEYVNESIYPNRRVIIHLKSLREEFLHLSTTTLCLPYYTNRH